MDIALSTSQEPFDWKENFFRCDEVFSDEDQEEMTPPSHKTVQRRDETENITGAVRRVLVMESTPKGRLWSQVDDDLEVNTLASSPKGSPKKAFKDSPRGASVKKVLSIIRENGLENSILPRDLERVKEASRLLEKSFGNVGDSPKRARYAEEIQREVVAAANIPHNGSGGLCIQGEEMLAATILDSEPWAKSVISSSVCAQRQCSKATLAKYPPIIPSEIRNWGHIRKPNEEGGFHFCPSTHKLYATLTILAKNEESGVFIAKFPHKGGEKTSSFFPESISSLEELEAILKEAEIIARTNNVELVQTFYRNKPLYVEQYVRDEHPSIKILHSFFPIFFYALLDSGEEEFVIQGKRYPRVTLERVLQECMETKAMQVLIVHTFSDRIIVDFAKILKIPGISKGIYFETGQKKL